MTRLAPMLLPLLILSACGSDTPDVAVPAEPPAPAPPAEPQPGVGAVAYTGAVIWDGTGGPARSDAALLVRDGKVEGIVATPPAGAEHVDLSGHWIIPGIVNAHGHVSGSWAPDGVTDAAAQVRADLLLYARYGVTAVLSLGGEPPAAFEVRQDQSDSRLTHARLWVAGDVVADATPEAAAATALANVDRGADWLKLRVDDNLGNAEKMPWPAVQVTMNTAKAADLPIATHIFYMEDAARLLSMGSSLIAHSVRDQPVSDAFVQQLLDAGVCYVPTLVREVSTFVYAERPGWFNDPFFLEAAKRSEMDRVTRPDFQASIAASPTAAGYREALAQAQDNLRVLLGSGVPVAFGTDSGPAGRFPGYFEHLEFELMKEAGLTPREILLSATSVAADCIGRDDIGSLEPGKWADFVVLAEDPLQDIAATRSIDSVYIAGNEVPR